MCTVNVFQSSVSDLIPKIPVETLEVLVWINWIFLICFFLWKYKSKHLILQTLQLIYEFWVKTNILQQKYYIQVTIKMIFIFLFLLFDICFFFQYQLVFQWLCSFFRSSF